LWKVGVVRRELRISMAGWKDDVVRWYKKKDAGEGNKSKGKGGGKLTQISLGRPELAFMSCSAESTSKYPVYNSVGWGGGAREPLTCIYSGTYQRNIA
jgi:hypothetical protein